MSLFAHMETIGKDPEPPPKKKDDWKCLKGFLTRHDVYDFIRSGELPTENSNPCAGCDRRFYVEYITCDERVSRSSAITCKLMDEAYWNQHEMKKK